MYIAQVRNFNWMFRIDLKTVSKPWEKIAEELDSLNSSVLENVPDNPFGVLEVNIYPVDELKKDKPTAYETAFFVYQEAVNPSYIRIESAKQMYEIIISTFSNISFVSKEDTVQNLAQAVQLIRIFK